MISINDLRFGYPEGDFELRIDRLEVEDGERVAVIGPSGSGKTSLLHLVAGITVPESGSVVVAGVDVGRLPDRSRRDWRIRTVGLVFQEFELLEYLSVRDNILLPFRVNESFTLDPEAKTRAEALAEAVGIADKLDRFATRLSQGEKQRVAVCRALVTGPVLLLADEPTGNLDPKNTARVLDILFDAVSVSGATLVTVTHEYDLLDRFERVVDFTDYIDSNGGEAS